MTFDPNEHPRAENGLFAAKPQGKPEVSLGAVAYVLTVFDPIHGPLSVYMDPAVKNGYQVRGDEGTVTFTCPGGKFSDKLPGTARTAYELDVRGERTPVIPDLVTISFEGGETRSLPEGIRAAVRGLSEEGYVIVAADFNDSDGQPYLYGLTPCCQASAKGISGSNEWDGYVGCRACYQEVDPSLGASMSVRFPVVAK